MISPRNLKAEKPPRDNESIFLEHYNWLLDRARHLTAGSSEEPEDLVQELYISFVRLNTSPQFNDASHAQAYFRKALRNLFASKSMRHGKDITTRLTLVDFDSLESALAVVDRRRLLNVRSDLARICEYILLRRAGSKGATAFIMRFFFGYLPSEITSLLKLNRKSLEKMLLTTRLEAKAYVERPNVLRIFHREEKSIPAFPSYLPENSEALFAELQRRMFLEPIGAHSLFDALESIYSFGSDTLTLEQTAHLGSCRSCLERAGQLLEIPDLLLQLFPEESGSGGPTSPRGVADAELKKLRRKDRETFEHRPTSLQIIIDGQLRGVQEITGSESRLQLTLKPRSTPDFVEIRSEQGISMLYFDLENGPELLEERKALANFSEGRTLIASLRFADGAPVIEVSYTDLLWESPDGVDPLKAASAQASTPIVRPSPRAVGSSLAHAFPKPILIWFRKQPLFAWATSAIAIVVVLLLLRALNQPQLRRSAAAEAISSTVLVRDSLRNERAAIPSGGGFRAVYRFEKREANAASSSGGIVEAVKSPSRSRSALRLISGQGIMLAGRWTNDTGEVTRYPAAGSKSHLDPLLSEETAWVHTPDVEEFVSLAGRDPLFVTRTSSGYELGFQRSTPSNEGSIVGGRLRLNAPSLHPAEENLEVQEQNGRTDYHFSEVSFQILSPEAFDQGSTLTREALPSTSRARTADADNLSLALGALEILQSNELAEDCVEFERDKDGGIRLYGVLPSTNAKESLIARLKRLPHSATLILDLHAPGEKPGVPYRHNPPTSVNLTSIAIPEKSVLWESLLRDPLRRDAPPTVEERRDIDDAAHQLVTAGARAHREAWLIAGLSSRWFTERDLRFMRRSDQKLWAMLVWRHLLASADALREICLALQLPAESSGPPPPKDISSTAMFALESDEFLHRNERLDELLTNGFAIAADTPTPPKNADPAELLPLVTALEQQERLLADTIKRLQ